MNAKKRTAGDRMIESARQALAFARGEDGHGCVVHVAPGQRCPRKAEQKSAIRLTTVAHAKHFNRIVSHVED